MLFGVHSHYNNNSETMGEFYHPVIAFMPLISELPVRVTNKGLVIFNLYKTWNVEQKLQVAEALHAGLQEQFSSGVSFATCGMSDCLNENELKPFYNGMKRINPDTKTLFVGNRFGHHQDSASYGSDLEVDYFLDHSKPQSLAEQTLAALQSSQEDQVEPNQGRDAFEDQLNDLFARAQESVLPADVPRHVYISRRPNLHRTRLG